VNNRSHTSQQYTANTQKRQFRPGRADLSAKGPALWRTPVVELRSPNPTIALVLPESPRQSASKPPATSETKAVGEREGRSLSPGGAGGLALLHAMDCLGFRANVLSKV
jgi:hypothetical protein